MSRTIPITPDDGPEDSFSEEEGLSLEELSQTYAQLSAKADMPYEDAAEPPASEEGPLKFDPTLVQAAESVECPVTPKSILEAILFVGHPQNEPISPERICSLMRGVRVFEVDQWVVELNQEYREENHAFEIVTLHGGYRLQLCQDLHRIRDRMFGKIKETRMNQAAIDCLALVAYQPGIEQAQLERQWNRPAASVLRMLVRRNLLELRRDGSDHKSPAKYYPTERMLNLFGLASLEELPRVEDVDLT